MHVQIYSEYLCEHLEKRIFELSSRDFDTDIIYIMYTMFFVNCLLKNLNRSFDSCFIEQHEKHTFTTLPL